jgi:hypothetical protein
VATLDALADSVAPQDWLVRQTRLRSLAGTPQEQLIKLRPQPASVPPVAVSPATVDPAVEAAPAISVPVTGRCVGRLSVVAQAASFSGVRLRCGADTPLNIVVSSRRRPDLALRSAAIPATRAGATIEVRWPPIEASAGEVFQVTVNNPMQHSRRFWSGTGGFKVEALCYG